MTRDFPEGNIRVSDSERDRAIAELSEHFQTGRLTQEEFDDRSTSALRARTGDDLQALFTDLPLPSTDRPLTASPASPGTPPAQTGTPPLPPRPARRHGQWPVARIVIVCVIASIIIGNVAAAVSANGNHVQVTGWVLPVVVLLIVLRRMGRQ